MDDAILHVVGHTELKNVTATVTVPVLNSGVRSRGVHGNGEDWDSHGSHGIPMGMGVRSAMGWEWDGNGN